MAPENQIMDLLIRRHRRLFCEECIVFTLRLSDLSTVRTAIDAIASAKSFRRATGTCRGCGGAREGIEAL
jgi:hypothetical protein